MSIFRRAAPIVLKANHLMRQGRGEVTKLPDGYVSMRIPKWHWPILRKWDPELESTDPQIRLAAWKRLEGGPLGDLYRVTQRGPRQVKRASRYGNKGIIIK